MDPLRIVVVDEHPPMAMPVIDLLVAAGHRPEAHNGGLPALAAIAARRQGGRPCQLVVANLALPDIQAPAFVRQLRERGERMPVVFYGHTDGVDLAALAVLGAQIIDLPIDRARFEALLIETARKATQTSATRIRTPLPEAPPGLLAPQTTLVRRTPLPAEAKPPSGAQPQATGSSSGAVVRQGGEKYANTVPTTTRFRRSITGRIENPALRQEAARQPAPQSWRVLCASCRREFSVEARPQAYNVVCVHCGQVNRIEPK